MTVQTLHDKHFDQGTILAQIAMNTKLVGRDVEPSTTGHLYEVSQHNLAKLGAATLVQVLRDRLYLSLSQGTVHYTPTDLRSELSLDPGWSHSLVTPATQAPSQHARKIVPDDRQIQWQSWTYRDLQLRHGALGQLWDDTTYRACDPHKISKRVIYQSLKPMNVVYPTPEDERQLGRFLRSETPGQASVFVKVGKLDGMNCYQLYDPPSRDDASHTDLVHSSDQLMVGMATCDKKVPYLHIARCTVESGAHGKGQQELLRLLLKKAAS